MKRVYFSVLICIFAVSLSAQPLPRKGSLNARTSPLNDSLKSVTKAESGLYVLSVGEGGTAAALKMRAGDVISRFNGVPVTGNTQLAEAVSQLREGDPVAIQVIRKKKSVVLSGSIVGKPAEKSDEYEVMYDRVFFAGGFLSMIITKPFGEGPFPVIYFLPGYMCYSLDNIGDHPYGKLVSGLTKKGYAVVRVEKLGQGASMNTPDCRSSGFSDEVEGFRAGLKKIYTIPFIDKKSVFVFGHSLGAMQAPLVAKDFEVKGIMIEGTSGDTWFEYILAMFRFQNPIMGKDPAENEAMIQSAIPLLYTYLVEKEDPALLARIPAFDTILREMMQYDGNGYIWDRHYTYWQELQDVNQAAAWRDCDAMVLVMRGSGDLEAFSTEQHEGIVRIINHYHPGKGSFVLLRNTDHAFCKSDTPEESYKNSQVKGYHYREFNEEVINVIHDWMQMVIYPK
ncbi:MAG: alpha/beta fold hydrolase [Bacteroidales bacterium]